MIKLSIKLKEMKQNIATMPLWAKTKNLVNSRFNNNNPPKFGTTAPLQFLVQCASDVS